MICVRFKASDSQVNSLDIVEYLYTDLRPMCTGFNRVVYPILLARLINQ